MILSKNDYNMSVGLIQNDLISSRSRRIQRVLRRSPVSEQRYGLEWPIMIRWLEKWCRVGSLFRNCLYKVHFVFSILKDKLKVIMFYIAPSGRKIQKLEFPSFKSSHWYLYFHWNGQNLVHETFKVKTWPVPWNILIWYNSR